MATKNTDNIYSKIMMARLQFLESNPQKSGRNDFQKFNYYELDDIVPTATRICNELGLYTEIDMGANTYGYATLTVVNIDNVDEKCYFRLKMPEINNDNLNNALQDTGRCETYLRRYLYLLFLDIAQNDEVDASDNSKMDAPKKKPTPKPRNNPTPPTRPSQNKPKPSGGRLTLKQKNAIKKVDESLVAIANNPNLTKKTLLEKIEKLEKNGILTGERKDEIINEVETILQE